MIKNVKLKYQMYILIFVALFMIILMQLLYYVGYSMAVYSRAEISASQMMEQLAQNVRNLAESVESSARGLRGNKTIQELLVSEDRVKNIELNEYLAQIVTAAKAANSNIYGVFWMSNAHRRISDPIRTDNGIVVKLEEIYDFTSEEFQTPVFSSVMRENNDSFYYFSYLFPVYSLYGNYFSKIGCGIIILDTRELDKLVKLSNITDNSLLLVLDHDNNIVVSNRNLTPGILYQDIFWEENESAAIRTELNYNGMRAIAQCQRIEENGWKIVSIIPIEELFVELRKTTYAGLWMSIICMCMLAFLGYILIRNVTRPVDVIVDFLKQMKLYSRNSRIETPLKNEIGVIALGINKMLDSVESMTRKTVENQTLLYEAKLAEQEAEVMALQSQINPHFLYNTLNCLSSIGLANNIPEVTDISVAMSNIYRYSIKGDNIVCLKDEIQCIKEYMRITEVRFNGRFKAEYRINDSILELYTLRMILQPIVENAVYHGLEQRSGKGKLIIEGRISDENRLIITVQDDGTGMTQEQLDTLKKVISEYENMGLYKADKTSIGLGNINKRIKLQFGDQYGLHIASEESVGTKVTVILPVKYEK